MGMNLHMSRTSLQVHALDVEWLAVATLQDVLWGYYGYSAAPSREFFEGRKSWAKRAFASAASASMTEGALRDINAYHLPLS